MSDEFARVLSENWAEATAKARAEDKAEIASALLEDGMSPDKVVQLTGLSIKAVNRLKVSLGAETENADGDSKLN